jgi:hypothetical protein
MAEHEKKEVAKRKLTIKNMSPKGHRFVNDASGKAHTIGPGQTAEVELAEPEAKRFEEMSKAGQGQGLVVEGHEPEPKKGPEVPEEQESRAAMAKKEAELMQEGQDADKERREEDAKKSGVDRAAETGIHMFARGFEPEVVALPPDAPAPKPKK